MVVEEILKPTRKEEQMHDKDVTGALGQSPSCMDGVPVRETAIAYLCGRRYALTSCQEFRAGDSSLVVEQEFGESAKPANLETLRHVSSKELKNFFTQLGLKVAIVTAGSALAVLLNGDLYVSSNGRRLRKPLSIEESPVLHLSSCIGLVCPVLVDLGKSECHASDSFHKVRFACEGNTDDVASKMYKTTGQAKDHVRRKVSL